MNINTKYLQKMIKEEISNQIVDVKESIEQDEWEIDVLDCAKGDICRLNDDVVGPDGSTFEIAVAAKKKDLGLVGSTTSAVKTRAQKLAKISSLREARLETIIREEAAALLAEEKMYQIGGPEYRAQTGVATPAEKFGIAAKNIVKGLDTRSIWSMADKGHYKGDSGTFRKQGRAMKHLLGIIKSYLKTDEPASFAQSGYNTNMVPGTGIHSSFDLSKLPAERSDRHATIKKLIATIQKLEAAAAKTAEKPAEPSPEPQLDPGQDVAVNEGAVPGEISAEDLTAAITLAIDEVFQEHRPNREAAAEAYDNIMESIDAIFRESYAASVRASKMMGAEAGFEDLDV